MEVSRRSFLKISAATGLLATGISGSKMMLTAFAENSNASANSSGEWKASTCQGCTTWCPVQVKVVDGRAIKVRGNPYSLAHRGNEIGRAHV